jgi:hypothetical protein
MKTIAVLPLALAGANPVFPDRWQSYETSTVHQGPAKQTTHGTSYWDLAANKVREARPIVLAVHHRRD